MQPPPPIIDVALVQRLVATQFPHWAHLDIRAVEPGGWDNRTFRLGEDMTVRLPSAADYAPQVDKEHHWLPKLAPSLPLPIPVPLAKGRPDSSYPWPWSIYQWLPGDSAAVTLIADRSTLAHSLARFLVDLQRVETAGGPSPGAHCFQRGAPVSVYDAEVRRAMDSLRAEIDVTAARSIWESAVRTTWKHAPVWFHGDVAAGNLLLNEGRLVAVIDFGCCGVGDPACDLAIAWTLFSGESRAAFRAALEIDDESWLRGQAWALWKALITIAEDAQSDTNKAHEARRVLSEILADDLTA